MHRIFSVACTMIVYGSVLGQSVPPFHFRNIVRQELGLAQNASIREILQDQRGMLWLGTGKGLYRYDGLTFVGYFPIEGDPNSISDTEVLALHEDTDGRIWIGTALHGVDIYDPYVDRFDRCAWYPDSLGRIWSITEDASGRIWIGSDYALASLTDVSDLAIYSFDSVFPDDPRRIIKSIVPHHDDHNLLWVGTRYGLFLFDKQNGTLTFSTPPELEDHSTWDCLYDKNNNFWCATYRTGIIRYAPEDDHWTQYDLPAHLKDIPDGRYNAVHNLTISGDSLLWIAAFDGLGFMHLRTMEIAMFNQDASNPVMLYPSRSYGSLSKIVDDQVFIGGTDIMSIAYPVNATPTLNHAPMLTGIEVNGRYFFQDTNVVFLNTLHLADTHKDVTFRLSVPEFVRPDLVRFRFKLEGYNEAWVNVGAGRLARYTNLKSGDYTFRYEASLDGVNWLPGISTLRMVKTTPFWKSPFAVTAALVLLVALLWLVNFLRIRKIRREAERKAEFERRLAAVEMTALRSQINPHFIFNCLSSIKYFILENEIEQANVYLTKFSQLIRAVLKNSQSQFVLLSEEIRALKLYIELESIRFREKFEFAIDLDPDIDAEHLQIPPMLIQPYVENAIWHGLLPKKGPRTLWIRVFRHHGHLRIEVEDNGIGREQSKHLTSKMEGKGKSLGMQITRDRIALIRETTGIASTVQVEDLHTNREATGTLVSLELPLLAVEGESITQSL